MQFLPGKGRKPHNFESLTILPFAYSRQMTFPIILIIACTLACSLSVHASVHVKTLANLYAKHIFDWDS